MNIKKGRPKKTVEDAAQEIDSKEESKPVHVAGEVIAFKNKIFIYKNGSTCTVTYGGCKDKPIEIKVL